MLLIWLLGAKGAALIDGKNVNESLVITGRMKDFFSGKFRTLRSRQVL